MARFPFPRLATALLLAAALASACGGGGSGGSPTPQGPGPAPGTPVPDFSLADVNPNSATYGTNVSPRDHLTRVSAWYFGHAT